MTATIIDLDDPKYIEDKTVIMTEEVHEMTVAGHRDAYRIFKVKLDALYYNDKNGRIATWINKYESENGKLDKEDRVKFNSIIHNFIRESNPEALDGTKTNIQMIGQEVPGVILSDGRVIDGNRRFTCLRELFEEKKGDSFGYFKTMILDGNYGPNDKAIKALELNLQLGKEKPLDYDPIERILDAYDNIVLTGTFTIDEYCKEANMSRSKVNLLLKKAEFINEFLDFIGAPGQYYIARELQLDGPVQDAVLLLKKCKNKEETEMLKNSIFADLAIRPEEDMTRHIRNYGKIVQSEDSKSLLKQINDNSIEVLKKIDESKEVLKNNDDPKEVNVINVIQEIRTDDKLKTKIVHDVKKAAEQSDRSKARELPSKYAREAFEKMDDIDLDAIPTMNESSKRDLVENLNALETKINEIRDCLDQ